MVFFSRTENISEDEKYYKTITMLDDKTGMKDSIDHGNISPRKCKNFFLKVFVCSIVNGQISRLLLQLHYSWLCKTG